MKQLMLTFLLAGAAIVFAPVFGRAEAAYPGADNLTVLSSKCNADGSISVIFGWTSYGVGAQQLDVSASNNGFQPSTYASATGLAPAQNQVRWNGLHPGVYFVRVLTQTAAGSVPSTTMQVTIGPCGPQGAYPDDPYFPAPAPTVTSPTPTYPGQTYGASGYMASPYVFNIPVAGGVANQPVSPFMYGMGFGYNMGFGYYW